jgi:hypothetical protein
MKNYKLFNDVLGWLVFVVASTVFILTAEATASFWDCGEFISCAYKLEVGHPPGAPTFILLGRILSLFTFGNIAHFALLVNYLSAVCSGFAVMFLFWIITYMAKKLLIDNKDEEISNANTYAVFGAGIVGAMAFTFCDSFWFSAVEGEVYAMAAFFTTIIFWCATKWDLEAEEKNSFKWIILIGYLIGLSIGVHLLNLLAIPAIGYIYYFRNYKNPTWKGIVLTTIIATGITGLILQIIIPQIVNLFATTELFFVNSFGLPFNSGTLLFILVLAGLITTGIFYTIKENTSSALKTILIVLSAIFVLFILIGSNSFSSFISRLIMAGVFITVFYLIRNKKVILNTVILCFTFLLIGYSTYLILIIRSNANTPLNENAPKNAITLLAYLGREQYGDWPLFYGQYYNAPLDTKTPYIDGNPYYTRDDKKGKYVLTDDRKGTVPNYDPKFCTIFPRMWKSEKADGYKQWADIKGTPVSVTNHEGESDVIYKPTFLENLKYFFSYQISYMYMRYLLWNFVGRQNDVQGFGDPINGNWISGIEAIDKSLVGPIDKLPENLKNKGTNHFYFLPLILGLIGMFFHFKNRYQDGLVVLIFFLMTGLAITLYLNQGPSEPRERDYAYAGSMMAFCIWIGMGVIALYKQIKTKIKPIIAIFLVTVVCFAAVPYLMAKDGWANHDRSRRHTMEDFACNYLNSCAPNAILFTNGDNDTFPLWYVQEVLGIRTDVRVVNLSLFNTDWYIDAMARKAYDSDPIPISMTWEQYKQGTRDAVYFYEKDNVKGSYELKELIDFVKSDNPAFKLSTSSGRKVDYFPTRNFKLTVDKKAVLASGTVSREMSDSIVDKMEWTIKGYGVQKNNLMVLDMIAHNNWKRPVYFSITTGNESYINLEKYFQLEGLAYRLVPIKANGVDGQTGNINTTVMYDNLMNKFKWGNMQDTTIYLDETNLRMTMNFRNNFARLADALTLEGKKDSAIKVLDKCIEVMPEKSVHYNYFMLPVAEAYYKANAIAKANKITKRLIELYEENLVYFFAFTGSDAAEVNDKKEQALGIMNRIAFVTNSYKQDTLSKYAKNIFDKYYGDYSREAKDIQYPLKKKKK